MFIIKAEQTVQQIEQTGTFPHPYTMKIDLCNQNNREFLSPMVQLKFGEHVTRVSIDTMAVDFIRKTVCGQ